MLSIDDLRVDSYATQLSELELTELKGGVTPAWLGFVAVAAAVTTVGSIVVAAINADNDHKECGSITTTVTSVVGGTTVTTSTTAHVCRE